MEYEESDSSKGSEAEETEFYFTPRTGETIPRSKVPPRAMEDRMNSDMFLSPVSRQDMASFSDQQKPLIEDSVRDEEEELIRQEDLLRNPWKTKLMSGEDIFSHQQQQLEKPSFTLVADEDFGKDVNPPFSNSKKPSQELLLDSHYTILPEEHLWNSRSPGGGESRDPVSDHWWRYRCMRWFGCTRKSQRLMWICLVFLYGISIVEGFEYRNGAVASENGICSVIGVDTLKMGGNAVDAAISVAFCLGVVNSHASGIGGGGFMMIRGSGGDVDFIDMREVAPIDANETMFDEHPDFSKVGGLSIAVPGELRGLYEAHKRYGNVTWSSLVEPAIRVAQDGFVVSKHFASILKLYKTDFLEHPYFKTVFVRNGAVVVEGDVVKMPMFAETLRKIADEGISSFYEGSLADSIVSAVKAHGGIMTHRDLKEYEIILRKPIRTKYRNHQVISSPAPTGGPILAFVLNILDQFTPINSTSSTNVSMYQELVEALKYGFARRTHLGDPEFTNITEFVQTITDTVYATEIRQKIRLNRTFDWTYYEPDFGVSEDHGTTHLSIVDITGMSVAFTSTINHLFGSHIVTETGIILNNHMDDFSIRGVVNGYNISPSPANYIRPRKRPLSSACPVLLEDIEGNLKVVLGASGGSRIISAVVQTLLNLMEFALSPQDSIAFPRLHHQLLPNQVRLEHNFPVEIRTFLENINHTIVDLPKNLYESSAQLLTLSIENNHRTIRAASDPRRGGRPAGY